MAAIVRTASFKFGPNGFTSLLCKASTTYNVSQVASMTRKAKLYDREPKPEPLKYWKVGLAGLHNDNLLRRFDENTRLVVVDGNVGVGKEQFAKDLADEFDMLYMPPPTFDDVYICYDGVDIRSLDSKLPPPAQTCDIKRFLTDPTHPAAIPFQMNMLLFRFEQYLNALRYILTSGRGVVLNRSVYSDMVFAEAMLHAGYMDKPTFKYYNKSREALLPILQRPHLIIYLDAPVDKIKEKIKQQGIPHEVNSKVLSTSYLINIEDTYQRFMRDISTHSHLLVYDWSHGEYDMDNIADDIECLNFEDYVDTQGKMGDWIFSDTKELKNYRESLLFDKTMYDDFLTVMYKHAPESMFLCQEDGLTHTRVIDEREGEEYLEATEGMKRTREYPYIAQPRFRRQPRDFMYLKEN